MLGWLFRRPLTRERAITIATEFLAASSYRVIPAEQDVGLAEVDIPLVFRSASIPGRRWYVEFKRVMPPEVLWRSHLDIIVYVWADTGRATFDHFEGWE